MSFNFSTDSWLLASLVITAITTLPVKLGADLFGALNKEYKYCVLTVVLGTIAAMLCFEFIGGFFGFVASFISISLIYWQILQISFSWSFIFTIIVMIIQFTIIEVLIKIGIFTSS